jgi:hypothetical protein
VKFRTRLRLLDRDPHEDSIRFFLHFCDFSTCFHGFLKLELISEVKMKYGKWGNRIWAMGRFSTRRPAAKGRTACLALA